MTWPEKWNGGAWVCPKGHQIHIDRYNHCKAIFKDIYCPGCWGWIDIEFFKYDEEIKQRTEGRKERENGTSEGIESLSSGTDRLSEGSREKLETNDDPVPRKPRRGRPRSNPQKVAEHGDTGTHKRGRKPNKSDGPRKKVGRPRKVHETSKTY